MKKGFTLIEVNMAMLIMAGAVLSLISLYSLGFRESRQAREDVAGAALAQSVINPLVAALSDPDLKWSDWKSIPMQRSDNTEGMSDDAQNAQALPSSGGHVGWKAYLNIHEGRGSSGWYRISEDPTSKASALYNTIISKCSSANGTAGTQSRAAKVTAPSAPDWTGRGLSYALVVSRENEKSPVITIAVRCVRKGQLNLLMSQPLYATEVHFQGDPNS